MENINHKVYEFLLLFKESCEDIDGFKATDIFVFMNNNQNIRKLIHNSDFKKLITYIDTQGFISKCDIGVTHYEITEKGNNFITNFNTNSQ